MHFTVTNFVKVRWNWLYIRNAIEVTPKRQRDMEDTEEEIKEMLESAKAAFLTN